MIRNAYYWKCGNGLCALCRSLGARVFLLSGDRSRFKSPETIIKEVRPVPVKASSSLPFPAEDSTTSSTLVSYWLLAVGSVDSSCFLTQDGSAAALSASCRSPLLSQNSSAVTDCPSSAVQTLPPLSIIS